MPMISANWECSRLIANTFVYCTNNVGSKRTNIVFVTISQTIIKTQTMSSNTWKCRYCGRDDFEGERGLTQHQKRNALCARLYERDEERESANNTTESGLRFTYVQPINNRKRSATSEPLPACQESNKLARLDPKLVITSMLSSRRQQPEFNNENLEAIQEDNYDPGDLMPPEDDDDMGVFLDEEMANEDEEDADENAVAQRRRALMEQFRAYTANAFKHYDVFSPEERSAIKCMHTLRKTRAPLSTYEDVMEWHLKVTKKLAPHEKLGDTHEYLTRRTIFKKLKNRYNMDPQYFNIVKRRTLPSSKSTVNIICNHAGALVRSLLTDPRIRNKDYLFFDNNPFQPPPPKLDYIEDINTGLSYTETYRRRITDPTKQILMMTPLYIDGAVTGQFSNLPVTQLKMTLGIFNQETRDKEIFWRVLGSVPKVEVAKSRGRRLMLASRHADGIMAHQDVLEGEGTRTEGGEINRLEDYHYMLDVIMESLREIQQENMIMDIYFDGKLYKEVEVLFFVPHLKVDNEEADKLVGKYGSRSGNVAHLCRQCHCPTEFTARAAAKYPLKTETEIKALIDNKDLRALQEMSQHCFANAFHKILFGLHNNTGIHGACPIDMLHTILLGIFMRVRDAFFEQVGLTSTTTEELDALAMEYGELLARKSERNMPKTKFGRGITGGKIMAKEYEGVLLLIAVLLRSSKGRRLLQTARSRHFQEEGFLTDWSTLVETLLGWIQWLKCKRLQLRHVKASAWKHRYLMYLIKKVVRRTKGMGMKFPKFHLMQHITQDIINHGNAASLDTGTNESGHKPTKKAALLTQKREDTFDLQTAKRLQESHLLDLAMEELAGRPLWHYLHGYDEKTEQQPINKGPTTQGSQFECRYDEETDENALFIGRTTVGNSGMVVESDFIDFVKDLQEKVSPFMEKIVVRTEHKRNGEIFRAHIKYRGKIWRDWVEINWGDEDGILPAKIWGFLDLQRLPTNSGVSFGGVDNLSPAVYAVVESATYSTNMTEINMSDIFVPIVKEVGRVTNGEVSGLKFYLAEVEAFTAPLTVIPDIGGKPNAYFVVKNRDVWREEFEEWLETPKNANTFTMTDDETSDSDYDDDVSVDEKTAKRTGQADKEDERALNDWEDASGDEDTLA